MIQDRVRVRTPHPCPPDVLLGRLLQLAAPPAPFDCVAVGFPGVVRDGTVVTAPNLGTDDLRGFDLATALARNPGSRCDRGERPRDDHHAWNGLRDGAVRRRPLCPTSRTGASSVSQGQNLRATAWKEGTTEGRPQEVEPNARAGHPHAPDAHCEPSAISGTFLLAHGVPVNRSGVPRLPDPPTRSTLPDRAGRRPPDRSSGRRSPRAPVGARAPSRTRSRERTSGLIASALAR